MDVGVGIDAAGDGTSVFYDGHSHPFPEVEGWHAPAGRRTWEPRPLAQARQIRPAAPVGARSWARPTSRSQDSPSGVGRFGGQAGTQAPDPTPTPGQNHAGTAGSGEAGPEALSTSSLPIIRSSMEWWGMALPCSDRPILRVLGLV